jgi:hypothetical protein
MSFEKTRNKIQANPYIAYKKTKNDIIVLQKIKVHIKNSSCTP